jgi:hypothetical protein
MNRLGQGAVIVGTALTFGIGAELLSDSGNNEIAKDLRECAMDMGAVGCLNTVETNNVKAVVVTEGESISVEYTSEAALLRADELEMTTEGIDWGYGMATVGALTGLALVHSRYKKKPVRHRVS